MLPTLVAACFPAQPRNAFEAEREADRRAAILFNLADSTGKPDALRNGDAASQTAYWAMYHTVVGNVPTAVLERAAVAYIARPGKKWMPDPGEFLEVCRQDSEWSDNLKLLRGLERLAMARPAKPKPSAEEEAEVSAKFAALLKRLKVREAEDRRDVDAEAQEALEYFKRKAKSGRMTRLPEEAA